MKKKLNRKRRHALKQITLTSLGLPMIDQLKFYDSKKNYLNQRNMKEISIIQFANGAIAKSFRSICRSCQINWNNRY